MTARFASARGPRAIAIASAAVTPSSHMNTTGRRTAPVTAKLPLDENAHLGKLARGPTVFFAEIRDANGLPYLRGCQATGSGSDVVIVLQHVVRPLRMKEGEVLDVSGQVVPGLHVVGPPRKGTLWETTAVPEIRGQAAALAQRLPELVRGHVPA